MKTSVKSMISGIVLLMIALSSLKAQVAINSDGSSPDNSAMLDVKSTTKGILIPRLTQNEIRALPNPADGLQVYCTTDGRMYIYVALAGLYKEIAFGTGIVIPPFLCGSSITINHVAGEYKVPPVNKTVTYQTVANIPGELSKCWITSNLGADHQATAVEDATEASAGWYWQFNIKQGYKHDGTTKTPNSWMFSIPEYSDWTTANDPCWIELGAGWHIPTYSEWYNVSTAGGWTTWAEPWDSDLKLHAAGCLYYTDGSLQVRGQHGRYWTNTKYGSTTQSYALWFYNSSFFFVGDSKVSGLSVRCVRGY